MTILCIFAGASVALAEIEKSIFDDDWQSSTPPATVQPPTPVAPTPVAPTPAPPPTPDTPPPTTPPTPTPPPVAVAPASAPVRFPIPTVAAQQEAWKITRELYKDEIVAAKTSSQKIELARKLRNIAADSKNDPAGRFVLLTQAKDIAISSGDPRTAFKCLGDLARSFDINIPAMKLDLFAALAKTINKPADCITVGEGLNLWAEKQVDINHYDTAKKACDIALAMAKENRSGALITQTLAYRKQIEEIEIGYLAAKPALATLASTPSDPAANLAVGQFLCYIKNEWDQGLPLLARGTDAPLQSLAKKELADPTEPNAQIEIADAWWSLMEKEKGLPRDRIKDHAIQWYREALPHLEGLAKAKAEKRIGPLPLTTATSTTPDKPEDKQDPTHPQKRRNRLHRFPR